MLARTGEYVPTSPIGRIGMAGVEAGVGSSVPGASLGETAANAAKTFVPNLIAGSAGQTATEATGNPLVGALVAPAVAGAAHVAGDLARGGIGAVANAVPPITETQKTAAARRQVGPELVSTASDPAVAQATLAIAPREIVPDSQGTTGPISGDTGLIGYEKAIAESPEGKAAYAESMAQQNAARQNAISGVQPTGNIADLPEAVRSNAAATDTASQAAVDATQARGAANQATVDAATKAHVEGAQEARQTALANIQALKPDASPLEVAQHFRAVRDALEQSGADSVAQTRGAADQARSERSGSAEPGTGRGGSTGSL